MIVSAGFHETIEPILRRERVEARVVANHVTADPAGWRTTFAERATCATCDEPCKRAAVAGLGPYVVRRRRRVRPLRLPRGRAPLRARRASRGGSTSRGVGYEPFDDLHDVREALAGRRGGVRR